VTSRSPTREDIEQAAVERHTAGAHPQAAEVIVRGFGPEILGFLTAMMRDEAAADEVFSTFCEQILKGLPTFERKCSFRTWSYTLARNAAHQYRLSARRRGGREGQLPEGSSIAMAAAAVRTETAQHLRTEVKSRFAALRDALPPEDRELLILRVDKQLGWDEIARVMSAADVDLKREAARLRKRFQLVKEKLRERGREEGLLGDD
jgi:RNA polymerase sigma-70 factor (ECF subfamily)